MKILITNDDGINARGMIPFVKWAKQYGDVTVYAPKVEQSGKSHGIEIHKPFSVEEVELVEGVHAYAVDSTPADCIRFAVLGKKEHYDIIFSGVNRGFNIGHDIVYSGTMNAASEAAYLGLKAVAFSTDVENYDLHFDEIVAHLDEIWHYFEKNRLMEKHSLYNVNIPENAKDMLITSQGGMYYSDDFDTLENNMYKAHGKCVYEYDTDLALDTNCVMNNHISITPISIDRTHRELFNELLNTNDEL